MLRSLAFALVGFVTLAGPAAARGDGQAGGRRAVVVAKGVSAKVEGRGVVLLRRVAAVRPAASGSLAACARAAAPSRGGAPRCRGAAAAAKAVRWNWVQGLPPALLVQAQECPTGTMATLAEGHDDIVRCIPI